MGLALSLRHHFEAERVAFEPGGEGAVLARCLTGDFAPEHGAGPDEPRYERRIGKPEHLVGAAELGDPALGHDGDHVSEPERLVEIVGHLEGRDPFVGMNGAQFTPEHVPRGGIDRRERLVEEQDAGPGGQRPGQRHPLGLAATQPVDRSVEEGLDAEQRSEFPDALPLLGFGERAAEQTVPDILTDVEVRKEMVVLVDESDAAALRRHHRDILAVQVNAALQRGDVARHCLEQRGLARPRRPDEQPVPATRHLEGDILQKEVADPHREPLEADHRRSAGWSTRTSAKTPSATARRSRAAGTAAGSPMVVKRS